MRRTTVQLAAAPVAVASLLAGLLTGAPGAVSATVDNATQVQAAAPGDATVVPLQVTGPPSERLNLVVLGDGYTAADMPKFREQVDKHLNIQWSIEPFRSYRSYLNVYMIEVTSAVSGISCDPDDGNTRRDTPLKLEYARVCPAEPNARGITFGPGGQAALNNYVAQIPGVVESNRQTLTLANTNTYGGIGGRNATTSGGNSLGPLISPHELGHSLGNLQDEYPYFARGVPGAPYTGGEPSSIHHTLLTVDQMRDQKRKWWRWLGEESLSGGRIDRFESGQYSNSGIWRPSKHSMMRWLGYAYDQVSRERMVERMSGRRDLGQLSINATPAGAVGPRDVLWVETPHPTYHQLDVTWTVAGRTLRNTRNSRNLELSRRHVRAGDTVTVTVTDPTEFVRDPELRSSGDLTATRSWTVGAPQPAEDVEAAFTASTQNERPVGGKDVVYVETTHPTDRVLDVTWRIDGKPVPGTDNARNLDLGDRKLKPGTHTLTATVTDPADRASSQTREWTIDNAAPQTVATLSGGADARPAAPVPPPRPGGKTTDYRFVESFNMGLDSTDDHEGFVVTEFRLDGDGWHNFYGWPDDPPGSPFRFTPRGTEIKALIYGALSPGGMSWAPFEDRAPGYGKHTVEFRAIDAAGNVSAPQRFTVTVDREG